jgi:pyruvate,water dikinase
VAFSRNPLTGLDEVVVEAVALDAGRDDHHDGAGDPAARAVTERWIHRWGTFTERPDAPRVAEAVIEEVVREAARQARVRGRPVELDWAHEGPTTTWHGVRPMTGLDGLRVYSNRIARDVLPGVIVPLVWSVNVPLVNAAWLDLLEELVGPLDVRPEDLARSFGHRAYFDMTTLGAVFEALGMPRDSLELLLGLPKGPEAPRFRPGAATLRHVPRIARQMRRTLRRGRWARAELRELETRHAVLAAVDPASLDEAGLLTRVDALLVLGRRAAYANIVVPLVMHGYDRALGLQLRAAGIDPVTADPAAGRADRAGGGPFAALDDLWVHVEALPPDARAVLATGRWAALEQRPDLAVLRREIEAALDRFGHISESANDFSRPTWREDRDAVVDLVLAHPERAAPVERLDLAAVEARVPAPRRPLLRLLWRRSGAFRVYRDAIGGAWTRCYGLFRGTFLALGERLVGRGVLDHPDDVFYLDLAELRAIVAGVPLAAGAPRALVARRRTEIAEAADLIVPEIVYGDAFVPVRRDEDVRATLAGIPTSRGSVRGPARVVRGTADFGRVGAGDVIVIPYSDVAWTPLFARAAGVVAESGGILSHSSIVAREYGIPCVVSVADACSRIPDGAEVVVDGIAGTVLVEAEPAA